MSGLISSFVVNGVDVTAFVEGELDRRHPERVQLKAVRTADDFRAMWATIERLWSETFARAGRLPETALSLRVDDEWSFIATQHHLVFATDAWFGRGSHRSEEAGADVAVISMAALWLVLAR